ncbi:pentatricopeptide repeat-containing protein At1g02150-like [Olea europaea var. sylvestris]|uniref:pentatricopeptide repeat-containing protein At1g02150-like n=1 Tax=Olea europaea var. sylvestris TaxID=158386 RepID=UPI000C1D83B8|nr:pentatricopeptide repeat-containing protein At1g02150-like [Olea europaea var. sylvestris]
MDARMQINAESFYNKMRNAGYASDEISFFTMLKFYEDLKDNDKVELLIAKMIEENIPLSRHSFNIWLWSCQNQESLDKLFKQAQRETTCDSSLDLFSSIAIMYNELGQLEKAQDCLNEIESRITDEHYKFSYLANLCGKLRNKHELYRVWENYNSVFPKYSSDRYSSVIYYLFKMDDIEDAEKIYEEWLSQPDGSDSEDIIEELGNDDSDSNSNSNSKYDSDSDSDYGDVIDEPRNYKRNYLLYCYVNKGLFKEAETFFNQMIQVGIKPNPFMWENLALLHIQERRISKALSCLRKFFSARGKGWAYLPSPKTVRYILKICVEESDGASQKALYQIFEEARISKSGFVILKVTLPCLKNRFILLVSFAKDAKKKKSLHLNIDGGVVNGDYAQQKCS